MQLKEAFLSRATEDDIALAIMKIAAASSSGVATFKKAYSEIPKLVKLTAADNALSDKRPGERMWQQLVRNIKSHHESPNNFINIGLLQHIPRVGYKITSAGHAHLSKK